MNTKSTGIKKGAIEIKHVPIWRVFWFTNLTITIHKNDPLFQQAQKSLRSKWKFYFDLFFKMLRQKRFVLTVDGQVVGALSIDLRKKSVFIYAVGVLKKFRRKGYGTRLMHFAEKLAKKYDRAFICFSVLLENIPAITLYKKLGYQSQGLGLTFIRFFTRHLNDFEKRSNVIKFKELSQKKRIKQKGFYWWLKEIEAFRGPEIAHQCSEDNLLDFNFQTDWCNYEIYQKNSAVGFVSILPIGLYPTIILFSDAKETWNIDWLKIFLNKLIEHMRSRIYLGKNAEINYDLQKIHQKSMIQIFLTHQHLEALRESYQNQKRLFLHDSREDRQIMFKKIDTKD